jgi:hypothetical protein
MSIQSALLQLGEKMASEGSAETLDSTSVEGILQNIANQYAAPTGTPGPKGDTGVGIKTITGTIDGSNKLTLTFTMTDESTQTVEGTITPTPGG